MGDQAKVLGVRDQASRLILLELYELNHGLNLPSLQFFFQKLEEDLNNKGSINGSPSVMRQINENPGYRKLFLGYLLEKLTQGTGGGVLGKLGPSGSSILKKMLTKTPVSSMGVQTAPVSEPITFSGGGPEWAVQREVREWGPLSATKKARKKPTYVH